MKNKSVTYTSKTSEDFIFKRMIEEKANVPSRSCWFAGGFTPFLTGLASCACQPLQ